jgi:hypothetical protein
VQVEDGKVIKLPAPKSVALNFVDWQDATHYITYDSDETCYSQNLRSVDVVTGKTTPIMDSSFYYGIAYSPNYQAFLFAGAEGCPNSPGEGTFLLPEGQTTPIKVLDKKVYEVDWIPESQAFYAYPEGFFSADGTRLYDPPVYDKSYHPAISYNAYQAWEVIENQQARGCQSSGRGLANDPRWRCRSVSLEPGFCRDINDRSEGWLALCRFGSRLHSSIGGKG